MSEEQGELLKRESHVEVPASYGAVRLARPGELPHEGEEAGRKSRDGSRFVTDEVFNAASHFVGAMLALLGGVQLLVKASQEVSAWLLLRVSFCSGFLWFTESCCLCESASARHWERRGASAVARRARRRLLLCCSALAAFLLACLPAWLGSGAASSSAAQVSLLSFLPACQPGSLLPLR